jgi:hypothetical protein
LRLCLGGTQGLDQLSRTLKAFEHIGQHFGMVSPFGNGDLWRQQPHNPLPEKLIHRRSI